MQRILCSAFAVLAIATTSVAQWGPIVPPVAPSPRSGALMAFDLLNNRTLLFGGNWSNEFWSYANGVWTQLTPAVLPGPRARANLATNPLTGATVMYGGQGGSHPNSIDETWVFDGTVWSQVTSPVTPGGRVFHAMAYDLGRQVFVLYGGRRDIFNPMQVLGETWEFDGTVWSQSFASPAPPALLDAAMAYHPQLGKVMLFGGTDWNGAAQDGTWTFDGTSWTQVNTTGVRPPARAACQLVPVLGRNVLTLVGGRDPQTLVIHNETWEHDGTNWRKIDNVYGGIYPPRAAFGVAHDIVRDRIVAFGGVQANNALRDDTWEYGAHWQPFGMGCAGTAGVPAFVGGALPRLGGQASATITNVPPAMPFAFLAMGLSRTTWSLGSLPALLTGFGMPGCRTYTSADLFVQVPAAGGTATWSWNVPLQASLVGEVLYLQGVTFDPGANPMGLAVSNAATMVVGN